MPRKFTGMDALNEIWADRAPSITEHRRQMAMTNKLATASIPQDPVGVTPGKVNPTGGPMSLYADILLTSSGNTITGVASDSKRISVYVDEQVGFIQKTLDSDITLSTAGYTSNSMYDIFIYWDNALDSFVLAASIWSSETAGPARTTIDGKSVLTSDNTWLYLTTGRYNGSTMLLPTQNPNGELVFGTGNPRNNVADPHTGVGMSAAGVTFGAYVWQFWAALNGVVGVGFNALGQLLFGAGKGFLDALGITLTADVYPSSAYIVWKAADDSTKIIGQLIATYAGAVTNSGLLVYGQAHDGAVRGFVQLGAKDNSGNVKTTLTVDTNGSVIVDTTAVPKGAGAGQSFAVDGMMTANTLMEAVAVLARITGVTAAADLGAFYSYYMHNTAPADKQAGYHGMKWLTATAGSETAQFFLTLIKSGVITTMFQVDPSGGLTLNGIQANFAQGADIASASTTNIAAATGNYVNITGTTTITAFGTAQAGAPRWLKFAGALTLTNNATSLILPGGANITTAAGDVALFISEGSGNWRCHAYLRASSPPVSGTNTGDVTIGTANGLSLAGQAISLALAVAGGANGALSGADKTKLDATSNTNTGDKDYTSWGGHGTLATIGASSTAFLAPFYSGAPLAAEADVRWNSPYACTLSLFRYTTRSAQPASGSLILTMRVANANTGVTVTVAAGAAAGVSLDNTHTAVVTAGQVVSVGCVNNATAASAQNGSWGVLADAT